MATSQVVPRASDSLPHPDAVDRDTTDRARALVEQATRPAAAPAPQASPQTLPADFFAKGQAAPPDTLPADFFSNAGATPQPAPPSGLMDHVANFAKNFWGDLANTGQGMVNAVAHPLDTIKGIGTAQDAVRLKAQDAMKRGDYVEAARHALSYAVPVAGPAIDARGDQAQSGDVSGALGGATSIGLQLAAPGGMEAHAPALVEGVGKAATATRGAAVAGAKAAVSHKTMIGAGTAEYLATHVGVPPGVAGGAVAGSRILRAAIKGGKAALADRLAAAVEKYNAQPAAPEAPPQFQPRGLLSSGPHVTPAPADTSFVRSVPAEYPTVEAPASAPAAPSPQAAAPVPTPRTMAQNEAAMMQKSPAPPDTQPSQFTSTGERKSSALRGEEIKAMHRIAKAGRYTDALQNGGLRVSDVIRMDDSHWKALADGIGEKIPSPETRAQVIASLKKLQPVKSSAPGPVAVPEPAQPMRQPQHLSPHAMSLAQQLEEEMRRSGTIQ